MGYSPCLEGGRACPVSDQIVLTEDRAILVGLIEAHGGLDVRRLGGRVTPTLRTGLQDEQRFLALVCDIPPAGLLEELPRVHAVRNSDNREIGTDRRLGRDVDLRG